MTKRGREGPTTPSGWTALHRLRTVAWKPSGVEALAHADGKAVAVARQSGRVELWDPISWTCTAVIPGNSTSAISALAWVHDADAGSWALISAGLSGQLECWDPQTLACTSASDSFGGAVWAMAVQPTQGGNTVAAGMDDGCVRLFTWTSAAGLQYSKTLQKVDGRMLSVAWHPEGTTLVGGSSKGSLHIWEAGSSTELQCIELEEGDSDLCVWAVEALSDGTIISGDSSGAVTFWDGQHGTRLCQFRHQADVLSLAASPSGSAVFAAGRMPRVRMYHRVRQQQGRREPRWEAIDGQSHHSHDVPSLLIVHGQQNTPQLVSGSHDSRMYAVPVARFLKERPKLVCQVPEAPQIAATPAFGKGQPQCRVLAGSGSSLELWELPLLSPEVQTLQQEGIQSGSPGRLSKLCSIRCAGDRHVQAACLRSDGSALAWFQGGHVRLLHIASGASGVQLGSPQMLAAPPAVALAFVPKSEALMLLHTELVSRVEPSSDGTLQVVQTLQLPSQGSDSGTGTCLGPAATMLAVAAGGARAAAAGPASVALLALQSLAMQAALELPKDAGAVTAVAFSADAARLAVAATGAVLLYDLDNYRLSEWSRQHGSAMTSRLTGLGHVHSISFQPADKGCRAVLAGAASLLHVDFEAPVAKEEAWKASNRRGRSLAHKTAGLAQPPGTNGRLLPLQTLCLACSHVSSSSLLLVEKAWADVLLTLPPPVHRGRYGS